MRRLLLALLLAVSSVALAQSPNPNVTLSGTLQGPNGLPLSNSTISLTPTQSFFVAGLGSSACSGYIISIDGTVLACGDTVNFNDTTPAAPSNGLNIKWQKSTSGTTDSVSAYVLGDGNASHCFVGNGTFVTCPNSAGGSFPANAQNGDILRYNVNNDSAWDNTNAAQALRSLVAYPDNSSTIQSAGSIYGGGGSGTGTVTNNFPTTTTSWTRTYSAAATASTNTVIGEYFGENGNNVLYPILGFYRFSTKLALGVTTNCRFWIGLGNYNTGGTGSNNVQLIGTTAYANDLPNKSTLGFRYSSTTDTHWQAVSIQVNGSSTVTDTGVTPDTNPHSFDMTSTGTAVKFWIDGTLVATISTNLPSTSLGYDSLAAPFWTGDNKNSNNAVSATWYGTGFSFRY